jgi:hypothetical protein
MRIRPLMAAALLTLVACSTPPPAPVPTATVTASSPTESSAAATTTQPTAAVTASPAPTGDVGVTVEDGGVRFVIPNGLAVGATSEMVPAGGAGDAQAPPWAIYPEHRRFTLESYAGPADLLRPTIQVFPTEAYRAVSPLADDAIAALQDLLAAQPATPESIPVLPVQNAVQLLRAQVQYLAFDSGRGVRFLTFYAQNAAPLSNPGLLYVYQGLTDDGRYVVSAILPVSAPILDPAAPAVPFPTADASGGFQPEAYEAYLAALVERLNTVGPAEVTPDLSQLDALVQSLQVA